MTEAKGIAWILYAVAGASGQGPADLRSIRSVADGINHAVPSHKELQSSLSWLCRSGLTIKSAQGHALTPEGEALMKKVRQNVTTTMDVWNELTKRIEWVAKSSDGSLKTDAVKPRNLG